MVKLRSLSRAALPVALALVAIALFRARSRPGADEPPEPAASASEFRVHRLSSVGSGELLERLDRQFGGNDTKFALEHQTNQLIVFASPSTQEQVASFLGQSEAPVSNRVFQRPAVDSNKKTILEPAPLSPQPRDTLPSASAPEGRRATIIPCTNRRVDKVAKALFRIAESRIVDPKAGPSGLPGFAFLAGGSEPPLRGTDRKRQKTAGEKVQVGIDHAANSLLVVAPVEAGLSVRRLVAILDTLPREGEAVRVKFLGKHRAPNVERALRPLLREGPLRLSRRETPRKNVGESQVAHATFAGRNADDSAVSSANGPSILRLDHPQEVNAPTIVAQNQPLAPPPGDQPPAEREGPETPGSGLLGDVEVQAIPGFPDILILRGNVRDVQEVQRIIDEIMRLSAETAMELRILPLENVGSESLAETLASLYGDILTGAEGDATGPAPVRILPLVKPNAVLIQAPRNRMEQIVGLITDLDQPVTPTTQFRVYSLKHATAAVAQQVVAEFYADRVGLGTRVTVTADLRSNKLLVQASPRDMAEVAAMIARLDVPDAAAVNEMRYFQLIHARADDMARLLSQAITSGLMPAGLAGGAGLGGGAVPAGGAQAAAAQAGTQVSIGGTASTQLMQPKSSTLKLISVDEQGQHSTKSGILTDVRVTPDPRTNAVLVSAPAESMDLMAELIKQLDAPPSVVAEVKVFTLSRGDAEAMGEMLGQLFGQAAGQQQAGAQAAPLLGAAEGETTLVSLRISVDVRSNSIIAAGSAGDLRIVEAILLKLDFSEGRKYENRVIRLRNSRADLVAEAISDFLEGQRRIEQTDPDLVSAYERFERDVVVVPELFTNSLIISATPAYLEAVMNIVDELDQDEPQVLIQVLLAEVTLGNTDEFGVELGIQDSILFDRSVSQLIAPNVVNTLDPGFLFNTADALGNLAGTPNSGRTGGQGASNFAVGRANAELGFGGLVLSASGESVSVLIRALAECRRLDVLSRPQIMTYNNQPAEVQIGQEIQLTVGTTTTNFGIVAETIPREIGLILRVTPRIRPDGVVVMIVDAEKSRLRPLEEGIPLTTTADGQVIRSPIIDKILASTTISASDGQTVVIGGLITKRTSHIERKVPFLGDIPILGIPFRFDQDIEERVELLIILTPHIVRNQPDAERIKQVEARRMDWILQDVIDVHGDIGVYEQQGCEGEDCEPLSLPPGAGPLAPQPAPPAEIDHLQQTSGLIPPHPALDQTVPQGRVLGPSGLMLAPEAQYRVHSSHAPATPNPVRSHVASD